MKNIYDVDSIDENHIGKYVKGTFITIGKNMQVKYDEESKGKSPVFMLESGKTETKKIKIYDYIFKETGNKIENKTNKYIVKNCIAKDGDTLDKNLYSTILSGEDYSGKNINQDKVVDAIKNEIKWQKYAKSSQCKMPTIITPEGVELKGKRIKIEKEVNGINVFAFTWK